MNREDIKGEGNPDADRRYRSGVKDTVDSTSEEERAEKARSVDKEQLKRDRRAEEEAKKKGR